MTEYTNYNELGEEGVWHECEERELPTAGIQETKDLIALLIADDKSKRRPDINQYTNRNDPSGEKRLAQAAEKRDWLVHKTENLEGAVLKILKAEAATARIRASDLEIKAGNARAAVDRAEAQANEAESALQQKLREISDEFLAKQMTIRRALTPEPKNDASKGHFDAEALGETPNTKDMDRDIPESQSIDEMAIADTKTLEPDDDSDWSTTDSEIGSEDTSSHESKTVDNRIPADDESDGEEAKASESGIDDYRIPTDTEAEIQEAGDHQNETDDDGGDKKEDGESEHGDTNTEESDSEEEGVATEGDDEGTIDGESEDPDEPAVGSHTAKVAVPEPAANPYHLLLKVLAQPQTPDKHPELVESNPIQAHIEFPNASHVCIAGSKQFPIRGDFFPVIKMFCTDNDLPIPANIRADKLFYYLTFEVTGIMEIDRSNKEVFLKTIADGLRVNFKHPAVYQLCVDFAPMPMTPKEVRYWYNLDEQAIRSTEDNSQILVALGNGFAEYYRYRKHRHLAPKYRGRGYLATITILRPPPKINVNPTILERMLAIAPSNPRKRRAAFEDAERPAKKFKLSPFAALKESSSHKQMLKSTDGVFRKGTWHDIPYEIVDVDHFILPEIGRNDYLVLNREFNGADGFYDPSKVDARSRSTKLRKLEEDVESVCEQVVRYGSWTLLHIVGVKAHDDRIYVIMTREDYPLRQIQLRGWDEPICNWGPVDWNRPFLYYGPRLPPAKFPESICTEKLHYQSVRGRLSVGSAPVPDCVSRAHGLSCGR